MLEKSLVAEKAIKINAIDPQDKILALKEHQQFIGPPGEYYISITNLDDSQDAQYSLQYLGVVDKKEGRLTPKETVKILSTTVNDVLEITNSSDKITTASKIEVKFYYRNKDNDYSFINVYYKNSYTHYDTPGEYLLSVSTLDNSLLVDTMIKSLKICNSKNKCLVVEPIKNKTLLHETKMMNDGIELISDLSGNKSKMGCMVKFYQHIN